VRKKIVKKKKIGHRPVLEIVKPDLKKKKNRNCAVRCQVVPMNAPGTEYLKTPELTLCAWKKKLLKKIKYIRPVLEIVIPRKGNFRNRHSRPPGNNLLGLDSIISGSS
jgi:hypothetical protein